MVDLNELQRFIDTILGAVDEFLDDWAELPTIATLNERKQVLENLDAVGIANRIENGDWTSRREFINEKFGFFLNGSWGKKDIYPSIHKRLDDNGIQGEEYTTYINTVQSVFYVAATLTEIVRLNLSVSGVLSDKCTTSTTSTIFPEELNTEEAKKILAKAKELGLIDDSFKWKRSKALLAYFADIASEHLKLGKGVYNERDKVSWKPFEKLFQIKGLAQSRKDYQNIGTPPRGHKIVDDLFDTL